VKNDSLGGINAGICDLVDRCARWHQDEVMVLALGFQGREMAWKTETTTACILK
jgi:hypothetical protein